MKDALTLYKNYSHLGIEVYLAKHIGGKRKKRQEDQISAHVFTRHQPLATFPDDFGSIDEYTIFTGSVLDGMGGHYRREKIGFFGLGYVPAANGATASKIGGKVFFEDKPKNESELYDTAQHIHSSIYALNSSRRLTHQQKVGTTFTGTVLTARYSERNFLHYRGYTLAVGNSPEIVIYDDGEVEQLTTDEVVEGETIYNSLGQQKKMVIYRDTNFFYHDFNPGDTLFLSSDGVVKHNGNQEIHDAIYGKPLEAAGMKLINHSLEENPQNADNLSLLLVRFQ